MLECGGRSVGVRGGGGGRGGRRGGKVGRMGNTVREAWSLVRFNIQVRAIKSSFGPQVMVT